jgi:hypothetical protein
MRIGNTTLLQEKNPSLILWVAYLGGSRTLYFMVPSTVGDPCSKIRSWHVSFDMFQNMWWKSSCLLTGIATRVGEERMGISRNYYMIIKPMQDSYEYLSNYNQLKYSSLLINNVCNVQKKINRLQNSHN